MMRPALTLCMLAGAGCVGEAEYQLTTGEGGVGAPAAPGGERPVQVGAFEGLSEGLPQQARLSGTAQLDGALYAVAGEALFRLPSGSRAWEPVALGVKASSIARLDTTLWVTVADGASGGLYRKGLSDDGFVKVAAAPAAPAHALLKRGAELLLATGAGLMASADRGATWQVRTTAGPFVGPVALVASSAAARIFAVSGAALWHSDDEGRTWSKGLVSGEVKAVGAEAEIVLVQTSSGALRSDNYGNTFRPLDLGAPAQAFAASGRRAFAGTMRGMRVSDDAGRTWRDSSHGLPEGAPVLQLFLAGPVLVASTGQAVYLAQLQ